MRLRDAIPAGSAYLLTKPRITGSVVFTAAAGLWLAPVRVPASLVLPHVLVFDNSNLANPFRKVAEFERGQSVVANAPVPRASPRSRRRSCDRTKARHSISSPVSACDGGANARDDQEIVRQ